MIGSAEQRFLFMIKVLVALKTPLFPCLLTNLEVYRDGSVLGRFNALISVVTLAFSPLFSYL